ncbi:hypothetical protein ABZ516_34530 [Streptomyces sp. NPDC019826]|uniref:hypothetical protein n=1 Tax=Streptomyces TaxID=1883 RepID=UPI002273A46E|nr:MULTISPECIES: hypothetical protein [unclassified Streptomyces]MCY1649261.1 hypothetical protein [Streptomyces sp. SL203]MCY1676974.1 hypothetical protein [Streptomyces sp. SL294]
MTIDQTPTHGAFFCPYFGEQVPSLAGTTVLVSVETDFMCPRFRAPDYVLQNGPEPSEVPHPQESLEDVAIDELWDDDDDEWSEIFLPDAMSGTQTLYGLGPVERGPECEPGEGCRQHA